MSELNSVIFTPLGNTLRLLCVLCFSAAIVALAVAIIQKRKPAFAVLTASHSVLNFALVVIVLDGTFGEEFFPEPRRWFSIITFVYSLPWAVLLAVCAVSAAASVLIFMNCYAYSRTTVSKSAIKESVDLLPAGICFGNADGSIVFTNVTMLEHCGQMLFSTFNNAEKLWSAVCESGERYGESYLIVGENEKAVLFSKTAIDYYGEEYTQIISSDVSERYKLTLDIKDKQKLLLDIQKREKEYGKNVEQLAASKELLYMNANFHDEIGHLLLRGRYHLNHPDSSDRAELLRFMREVNLNLFTEKKSEENDGYLDALSLAETIGVSVVVTGEPPIDKSFRELAARAVHECSVNLVKHAGGDTLYVSFERNRATFKNNGKPPKREITEAGGLRSLRRIVEEKSGEMLVESLPELRITIIMK